MTINDKRYSEKKKKTRIRKPKTIVKFLTYLSLTVDNKCVLVDFSSSFSSKTLVKIICEKMRKCF